MTPRETFEMLLRELEALDRHGKGDTPEYDALCDKMDAPWHAMNEEDQKTMRVLSAKLYDERMP